MSIAPYYKAVMGFVAPGATTLLLALTDGSKGGDEIVRAEWWFALLTSVVSSAAVFATPNKDPNATHQAESVQPPGA